MIKYIKYLTLKLCNLIIYIYIIININNYISTLINNLNTEKR